ncbi:hypothetical protein N7495_001071 [Penicillium taxi]|uniref:uncharacterized protein n=1 Tax=Penicillium taxi TaxID=168475 RepID=UPI0025450039|nr:uncharacterized protein N7495_001071 [Penicillium taxi]KAJ5908389.1 hypothetical protein N7495_001071 [Penicillium taxi]
MASGSCACHYIRYTTSVPPTSLINCHCKTCRKQAGAPYQSWVHFPPDNIQWSVEPTVWKSSDDAYRTFCPQCGSTLTMKKYPNEVSLAAGTLDDSPEWKAQVSPPTKHIYLEEKASWFELPEDGAARWDRGSDRS